jgi:folate-binding Fe-S cluster repair protein YgfZ
MGCGTIFLNPNGRILERVEAYILEEDCVLLLTSPGHVEAVKTLLKRNIFFGDDVVVEISPSEPLKWYCMAHRRKR